MGRQPASCWSSLGALAAIVLAFAILVFGAREDFAQQPKFKILHIMSYHSPWRWTDGQFAGFQEAMSGVPVEYKVFRMDTKRNRSVEAKMRMGREAMALIAEWKPDLVYTSDDDALEYVVKNYLGKDLPFVFSGADQPPEKYGFVGAPNVSGVLDEEQFVASVNLLRSIVPAVHRIVVVSDGDPAWVPVRRRMEQSLSQLAQIKIVSWDTIRTFAEYKRKIAGYPKTADAIALVGVSNFESEGESNVPYQDVLRWTAEHSRLPDFSFWVDRVYYGTLCAVTVSEREQGFAAGRIARGILVDHRPASAFPIVRSARGQPVISLARAKALGIAIKANVLLTAEVVQKYEWDK